MTFLLTPIDTKIPAVHLNFFEAFNIFGDIFFESLQNSGSGIVETNLSNFIFFPLLKKISFFCKFIFSIFLLNLIDLFFLRIFKLCEEQYVRKFS